MTDTAIHARTRVRIALYEAGARGELADPDNVLAILDDELRAIDADVAIAAERHASERAELAAELALYARLRDQADADAAEAQAATAADAVGEVLGFYVYYLWGWNNELLYVGLSTNILGRLGEHMRTRKAAVRRVTMARYPNESAMRRAETRAIRRHQPRWNVQGVVKRAS